MAKKQMTVKQMLQKQPAFISIDLGTANTLIYISGQGIIFNEPTILAYNAKNGKILYIGNKAHNMRGKVHQFINLVKPLEDGVISDLEATQDLLEYIFAKLKLSDLWKNSIVLMAAPSGVTELEQQALREIAHKMGARYVFIEQEAKMAALGLGVSINKPRGRLVVDVGGGTTDIAVVAAGDIVAGDSIKVAGNYIDREIQKLIRTKYNVAIGLLTAEKIKRSLSGLLDVEGEERIGAYGRNVSTGLPTVFGVDPRDIRKLLLDDAVARIVNAIAQLLEITPPELAADIKQSGIYLCGGGALLKGLDLFLEEKFKLPVTIAPQPLLSVIEGTKLFERQIVEILQYDDDGGVYVDN